MSTGAPDRNEVLPPESCPVCGGAALAHDVVDFSKSCMEARGQFMPLSGVPVYYFLCGSCGFCFAPMFQSWTPKDFSDRIYNQDYFKVDPDYIDLRPRTFASELLRLFAEMRPDRHLDYGAGSGLLSLLLAEAGWESVAYDPFSLTNRDPPRGLSFDLITAIEVMEHVADAHALLSELATLLSPEGMLLLTTVTSDGIIARNQRMTWWYASPRNGHISLHTRRSLAVLAQRVGLNLVHVSAGAHLMFRTAPSWATRLLGNQKAS